MLTKGKRKKIILSLGALLVVGIGVITILCLHPKAPASSQADYPVLPEPTATATLYQASTAEEIYSSCSLIAEGTVTEVYDPVTETIPLDGVGDKIGGSGVEMTVFRYKIHVDDALLGHPVEEEIILERGLYADAEPPLSVGDRMIFLLWYNETYGTYTAVYPHEGYYYIADDDKVYPAGLTDVTRRSSGMSLNAFKKEIRDYAQNHPEKGNP